MFILYNAPTNYCFMSIGTNYYNVLKLHSNFLQKKSSTRENRIMSFSMKNIHIDTRSEHIRASKAHISLKSYYFCIFTPQII